MSSTLMPFASKILPASIAFQTICPQAKIETSAPSLSFCAFPISKSDPSTAVKFGHLGRPKRKYTGPS